ncbi:MAG: carboxylating nicotinate-nucleotide diphosphorylase [Kiritimatiellae bacterium]|nr:carboxylating nicotinate-nucleotide diphosphorylase [Kiritimatiellia bacterium]
MRTGSALQWTALDRATRREAATLLRAAIREDVGRGDVTSRALVPAGAVARAVIVARRPCVLAGLPLAAEVFRRLDRRIRCESDHRDGETLRAGAAALHVEGPARALLAGERIALNFLQRLSGIATLTREFVRRVGSTGVTILDTRKTTPGWRRLEKYAVRCGGGENHRMGLYDRVLIKDNHRKLWAGTSARPLADAIRAARRRCGGRLIEIEVDTERELLDALEGRPDWILLDNMSLARLRRCVRLVRGRARLEASGGVSLHNVRAIAATGVDAISVGALTHSAPAADFGMDFL